MPDTGPPATGERITIPAGGAVLLDKLGAVAIRTEPADELALLLELGGRLNKFDTSIRSTKAYLMGAGHAAELIAAIVVAVQRLREAGDDEALEFARELDEAVKRERDRLGAVEGEHG